MTARTEAERTLRARVMGLDATAQEVLLAYLAGTARQAVESGLEFMAGIGLLDETVAVEGSPAEISEAAGDGGSPDQAATPASGPRPLQPARGPHLHSVPATYDEVRRAGHYEPFGRVLPVEYLGCGHSMSAAVPHPPGTEITCTGCGPALVVARDDWRPASAGAS